MRPSRLQRHSTGGMPHNSPIARGSRRTRRCLTHINASAAKAGYRPEVANIWAIQKGKGRHDLRWIADDQPDVQAMVW